MVWIKDNAKEKSTERKKAEKMLDDTHFYLGYIDIFPLYFMHIN